MVRITVICVGKLKEKYLTQAKEEYAKRLGGYCRLNLIELEEARLPECPGEKLIASALADEAGRIRAKLPKGTYLITLCIEGKLLSSEALAKELEEAQNRGNGDITFVIGSSHGIDPGLKEQSDLRLSMSPMTFPHQLARILLLEQIYRAFSIANHGKYHK